MRILLASLLLMVVGMNSACLEEFVADMRIANSSDSDLCANLDAPHVQCRVVEAHTTADYKIECGKQQLMTIVLSIRTPGEVGQEIYKRTAPCIEWDDATFSVKRTGDEFEVTDSLP